MSRAVRVHEEEALFRGFEYSWEHHSTTMSSVFHRKRRLDNQEKGSNLLLTLDTQLSTGELFYPFRFKAVLGNFPCPLDMSTRTFVQNVLCAFLLMALTLLRTFTKSRPGLLDIKTNLFSFLPQTNADIRRPLSGRHGQMLRVVPFGQIRNRFLHIAPDDSRPTGICTDGIFFGRFDRRKDLSCLRLSAHVRGKQSIFQSF